MWNNNSLFIYLFIIIIFYIEHGGARHGLNELGVAKRNEFYKFWEDLGLIGRHVWWRSGPILGSTFGADLGFQWAPKKTYQLLIHFWTLTGPSPNLCDFFYWISIGLSYTKPTRKKGPKNWLVVLPSFSLSSNETSMEWLDTTLSFSILFWHQFTTFMRTWDNHCRGQELALVII